MTDSREPHRPPQPQRAPYPIRLALAAWVIAEAAAFFGMVYLIGIGYTLMIFIGTSFIGVALVQYVGAKSFRAAREYLNSGGDPTREPPNGYALAGAVCLIVPGFVTDLIGLLLLLPPTRLLFKGMGRWIAAKTPQVNFGASWGAGGGADVIDGEVIDEREPGTGGERPRGHDEGPRSIE